MVLVGTIGRFQSATSAIAILFALLWLIPILRLLPPMIRPGSRSFLYAFLPALFLEGARILIPFSPALKREVFLLSTLLALILLVWMIRPARLRRAGMEDRNSRLLVYGVRAGIALLVASLVSNVLGFLSLSQVLGMSVLLGFFSGAALLCAFLVFTLILTILLQTDWSRSLLQARTTGFERCPGRVLGCVAILAWLHGMSQFLTIHADAVSALSDALQYPSGYGELRCTIGGSLCFFSSDSSIWATL